MQRFKFFIAQTFAFAYVKLTKFLFSQKNGRCNNFQNTPKRIIIIKVDRIGDYLMITPFLRELRYQFPHAELTFITTDANAQLSKECPYINKTVVLRNNKTHFWDILTPPFSLVKQVRKEILSQGECDLALLPRHSIDNRQATFIAFFCNAKKRVGYSEKCTPEKMIYNKYYDELLTDPIIDTTPRHETDYALGLLDNKTELSEISKKPEVWTTLKDKTTVESLMAKSTLTEKKYIILGVGAGEKKKRWPLQSFVELIDLIHQKDLKDTTFVCLGSKEDRQEIDKISQKKTHQIINLCGKTNLRESYLLIEKAKCCITNDSAMAHLTAATKTPLLVLSCHPENASKNSMYSPSRVSPVHHPKYIIQPKKLIAPCTTECSSKIAHCISTITSKAVFESYTKLLVDACQKDSSHG